MIQVRGDMRKLSLFQDGTMSPDLDVKTVMDTWTLQMGFPLVSVSRDYEARTASVTQERFLVGERRPDLPRLSWWVPLTFTGPGAGFSNTYNRLWLRPDTAAMEVQEMPDAETPVIFNIQQTGYYR